MTLDTPPTVELDDLNIQYQQVRGSPNSEPSEISLLDHTSEAHALATTPVCVDSVIQDRFDMAVDACRGVNRDATFFHRHKDGLVKLLDPAYGIFHLVKHHPYLKDQLYNSDLLTKRTRKLSKNKVALACVYCVLKPKNDDDFKACSDYKAYLLEAEAEETSPDDFLEWAKPLTLKECLKSVRRRKRDEAADGQDLPPPATADLRLSITRGPKGVRGSIDGRRIPITEPTLDAILDLIRDAESGIAFGAGDEGSAAGA